MSAPQRDVFVPGIAHPLSPRAHCPQKKYHLPEIEPIRRYNKSLYQSKSPPLVQEKDEGEMHQKITIFFQGFPQDGLAENGRLQYSVLRRSYDLKDEWIQVQGNPPTRGMPADHSGCFGKR